MGWGCEAVVSVGRLIHGVGVWGGGQCGTFIHKEIYCNEKYCVSSDMGTYYACRHIEFFRVMEAHICVNSMPVAIGEVNIVMGDNMNVASKPRSHVHARTTSDMHVTDLNTTIHFKPHMTPSPLPSSLCSIHTIHAKPSITILRHTPGLCWTQSTPDPAHRVARSSRIPPGCLSGALATMITSHPLQLQHTAWYYSGHMPMLTEAMRWRTVRS